MNRIASQTTSGTGARWHAAAVTALAVTLTLTSSGAAFAQSSGLVGTWLTQVTLRNCQTNAPLGPPFYSLVTFHSDGTLSENPGGTTFAPGQRTAGHGSWTRQGPNTYSQNIAALLLFDTPAGYPVPPGGFLAGGNTITHTVTLLDADHFTSAGTNALYTNAAVQYRTGCSTASGQRFQ